MITISSCASASTKPGQMSMLGRRERRVPRAMITPPSFPRKRESRGRGLERCPWTPACAGVTKTIRDSKAHGESGVSAAAFVGQRGDRAGEEADFAAQLV